MKRRPTRMLRVCTFILTVSQGLGRELLQGGLPQAPVPAVGPLGAALDNSGPAAGCTTALKPEAVVDGLDGEQCWGGHGVTCRASEMTTLLEAFEGTLTPTMKTFISDLEEGGKPFTFLLPPEAALQWFESISFTDEEQPGAVSAAMLQDNLLMHVLEGYHSPRALRRAAELGTSEPLKTVSGVHLVPQLIAGGDVMLSLDNSAAIAVLGSEAASCKSDPPSLLVPITHMLCTEELQQVIEDSDAGIPPDVILVRSKWRGSNSYFIWSAVLCLAVASVIVLKLRQRRKGLDAVREAHAREEEAEVARMAAVDAALVHAMAAYQTRVEEYRARAEHMEPPKVLTRLDSMRWVADVLPKQLSRQLSKSLSATTDLPYVGSSRSMQMTKQRSVLSTQLNCSLDVDACGPKQAVECVICYEGVGDHVLLPCGHGGYCGSCAHTMLNLPIIEQRLCPVCRAELHTAVQVNLSTPVGAVGHVLAAAVSRSQMSADLDSNEGDMEGSRTLPVLAANESSSEELLVRQ